jgi:hypothetical protein
MLVGNKLDLEAQREVFDKEVMRLADKQGWKSCEVSARTGTGIKIAIEEFCRRAVSGRA